MLYRKFRAICIMVIFISIISFPFIDKKLGLIKDISSTENRQMKSRPNFDINLLDPFPSQYEDYYNDNFPVRAYMVKAYSYINLRIFKKSPSPDKVIIGSDNWLFSAGNEIDTYSGKNCFSREELESIRLELEYRYEYLKKRNCLFIFFIAPVKANIYPEYLPKYIYKISDTGWGKQLINYLSNNSTFKPLDIYQPLSNYKAFHQLYYKLDNHWTQWGGLFAANEVLKQIKPIFHNVEELNYSNFYDSVKIVNEGNILGMLSNPSFYSDSSFKVQPKDGFISTPVPGVGYPVVPGFPYPWEYEFDREIKGSKKPRLLIISDSFGVNIFPFLSEEFSRSVKIFDSWQYKLNEEIVDAEKPDVFLLIVLESNLKNLLNNHSRLKQRQ